MNIKNIKNLYNSVGEKVNMLSKNIYSVIIWKYFSA